MNASASYPHLFSPFTLGRVRLPNRLVVPALTTNYGSAEGFVTDALTAYLAARARGGFGLVVTENLGVHPTGRVMPRMLMVDDDRYLPGLGRLAAAVKREGAAVIGQLSHAGRQTKSKITGLPLVAPSPIACPINREVPRALDVHEVREMEQAFILGAERLRRAGFDGVEIHGAHGYLVAEFLSRYSNRREDEYGGSLDGRMQFLLNIVDGIRQTLGDFTLVVRLSAREFVTDGLDLPESIEIARRLVAHGVDAVSVTVGVYESFNRISMVSGEPEGQWLGEAQAIRQAGVAVMGVGRIKRPSVAEDAIRKGQVDLAAFGRASIADPDLPRKARAGHLSRILTCMGCNICLGRTSRPETICPVNPTVGREREFEFSRVTRPLRLVLHGTSLASLTAAWVAARRGHAVTVYEPSGVVGGMQGLRARVPGQEEIAETIEGVARRAADAGAIFVYDPVRAGDYHALWGERRFLPLPAPGPGAPPSAVTVYDVLERANELGGVSRAIVLGDDLASADAAVVLADRGLDVELRSPAPDIVMDAHPGFREVTRRALGRRGARITTRATTADARDALTADVLLVVGRDARRSADDDSAWQPIELPFPADGWLGDAYEPGRMTATVYDAVSRAMALGEGAAALQ